MYSTVWLVDIATTVELSSVRIRACSYASVPMRLATSHAHHFPQPQTALVDKILVHLFRPGSPTT
jgi:hypothetical protein